MITEGKDRRLVGVLEAVVVVLIVGAFLGVSAVAGLAVHRIWSGSGPREP